MADAEVIPHIRIKLHVHKHETLRLLISFFVVSVLLVACGGSPTITSSGHNGKGCQKIGVLFPDVATTMRWQRLDLPLLILDIKAQLPRAAVDYNNAEGNAAEQQNQANAVLANGDCILVVAAVDSVKAAAIVSKARQQGVPVIAYDRLIQSRNLSYYVAVDHVKLGELQGQYIADHYKEFVKGNNDNVVMINGPQTDNNAILFRQGALHKLQPLFNSGALTKALDVYTPYWDEALAQHEMTDALEKYHNNIQIVYAANNDLANGAITALKQRHLNGKALVIGLGVTVIGIQNILMGNQEMTVYNYKGQEEEALKTAELVAALSTGTGASSLAGGATIQTSDGGAVPAILVTPILVVVERSNIASTVIADGIVSMPDVCSGLPAGANTNGLCQ